GRHVQRAARGTREQRRCAALLRAPRLPRGRPQGRVLRWTRGRAPDGAQPRSHAGLARRISMTAAEARDFRPLAVAVLTVSDTRDDKPDKSGALLVERVRAAGHRLAEKAIVRDDVYAIRAIVSRWIADPNVEIVLTTGGTGLTGRDGTPEAI